MQTYFPPIQPFAIHRLPVQPPHELYIEECGNPHGLPVLYLHGGPGAGCSEDSRRLFDPNRYRIIIFDQRGAGRSKPHADLIHNNTQALVHDIEAIREKLGIDRWVILGGSWGTTLGLVYAQTYPQHVIAMILRGIFLARNEDRDWLYGSNGAAKIYPDYWEDFIAPIPLEHRHHPLYEYFEILNGENEVARMGAAETWSQWEARCSKLTIDSTFISKKVEPHHALSFARIECHYMINNCFLEPDQILRNMAAIQHIPSIIIHGRYDMVCLMENAWLLHKAWPLSRLLIVPESGHSSSEPEILNAMILATQKIADDYFSPPRLIGV